jgi:hypothetical protein
MPSERVLRWSAEAVHGTRVRSAEDLSRSAHRASGTFRLRIEGSHSATAAILKAPSRAGSTTAW